MQVVPQYRRPHPAASGGAPPGGVVIRFVTRSARSGSTAPSSPAANVMSARASALWSASSPWPHHPAILPPLPRPAKSAPSSPTAAPLAPAPQPFPRRPVAPAIVSPLRPTAPSAPTAPERETPRGGRRPASAHQQPAPARRPERNGHNGHVAQPAKPARPAQPTTASELKWPETFDDWMIDIVRRRTLRLNSGARRRGVQGSVRAVDLAHILERSRDAQDHWTCALCHRPVVLTDLSFDHVIALADGGEHAAHNLVPAHRKCNELKGSEKAQYRTQALDRWLTEWATKHPGAAPKGASRHSSVPTVARSHDWRLA